MDTTKPSSVSGETKPQIDAFIDDKDQVWPVPHCNCDGHPLAIVKYAGETTKNPGRAFFSCSNFKGQANPGCGGFLWVDDSKWPDGNPKKMSFRDGNPSKKVKIDVEGEMKAKLDLIEKQNEELKKEIQQLLIQHQHAIYRVEELEAKLNGGNGDRPSATPLPKAKGYKAKQ